MTSISQPVIPPQAPSNASQTVAPAHSPSPSASGRAPPQAAGTASAKTSYASATKKPFSPPTTSGSSTPVTAIPTQHGKIDRSSPVNGKVAIPPAVPAVGTPTIVNGNTPTSSTSGPGDHSRKASVTISAAGAPGNLANGGLGAGKPSGGNGIQFGSAPSGNSLAVNTPANPRVTSPTTSPSPIPQPAASGGKPPSTLHGHRDSPSFGSFGGAEANMRPGNMAQSPLAPGAQHLRRESSQSQHSDMSNHGMGPGAGRGGYPPQGGRGRGYGAPYQQQMPYSPNPNYRQPPPNQPGNRPNMPPYQQQARSFVGPYPNSPHQAARSPAPPNAQPAHPQHGQMPMPSPQMGQHPYGGYPNQYGGYNPHMGAPQVAPHSHYASKRKFPPKDQKKDQTPLPNILQPLDLSPAGGQFEQILTLRLQGYPMPTGLDPNYMSQYYHFYGGYAPPANMAPQSPRPSNQMPHGPQTPFAGQYGGQPQPMSRTSSAISGTDRPSSSAGKPQNASVTPSGSNNVAAVSRAAASPAPKASSTDFKIPQKKSAGIVIRNPNSGDIVDLKADLKKPSASPAPSSKSPANISAASTPPPRAPSVTQSQHSRTESKSVKTDAEKILEFNAAVAARAEAAKAEKQEKDDEESTATQEQDKKDVEAKLLVEKKEADAKQLEAAKAQMEAEAAIQKHKAEAEEAEKIAAKAKEGEDEAAEKARKDQELEDEIARWEAEAAEKERKEEEREKLYAEKKKAEKEEAARKEAEAFKMADDEMKRAEREAEEAEEARLKELEHTEGEDSQKERDGMFAALKKEDSAHAASETPAAAETPEDSGAATPPSEVSVVPPKAPATGGKPKPAALKLETTKPVEPAQPTPQLLSLRSARQLTSINDISYPAPINSPNPALNTTAPNGKFKYDRDFLMQFQRAFVEKPSENWTERIKETVGDTTEPSSARATSARGGAGSMGVTGRQGSNRAPLPQMGAFAQNGRTLPPGTTSQARFEMASRTAAAPARPTMQNPLAGFVSRPGGAFPQPAGSIKMDRSPSSTNLAHPNSPRNASQRGGSQRGSRANTRREDPKDNKAMPLTAGANLKPIEVTATGWKPRSVGSNATGMAGPAPGGEGLLAPDVVQRKVKSNLNKMTPNNFDKITGQILAIAHQSKDETDGRSLRQVIQLTFEKATDEAHWAEMYANFCKRMLESMSPEIKDESILDKKGEVVAGGALFRKYLLTRCQTEFERGWKMNLPDKPEGETEEAAMLSDAYYVAAAAKRRGLGLVRFIGELYKLQMLTERIMHECVKKLVDYEGTPDEAEVESLTSLLRTIGQQLDNSEKGHQVMDAYFGRIKSMIDIKDLQSRLKFMLMDIVELREKNWKGKSKDIKGPTTLDEVRQQAVEAERQKELQRMQDNSRRGGGGGGRPPIGRGDARNFSGGGQYGMMPPPDYHKNTVGMDDLRRLGSGKGNRQTSSQGPTFGPTSMFSSARGSNTSRKPLSMAQKDDSGASSRVSTPPGQKEKKEKDEKEAAKNANTFSALVGLESSEATDQAVTPNTSPPTTKSQPAERQRSKSPASKEPAEGEASNKETETS